MIYKYPENFARFYDVIYHQMRDSVDNDFFQDEVRNSGGRILEIGVGTGRLFINSLWHGADIHGIDISEEMLRVLRRKLTPEHHHRISLQNMINFKMEHGFDLVIAPFRVFMHLLDKEDQISTLNNVYDHLKPGGKFIFDTFVPDLAMLLKGLRDFTDFEGEYEPGKKLKRTVSTVPDLMKQLINISFCIEWEEDGRVKKENWDLPIRYFFRYELEHLVERSKFRKYNLFGDYKRNTPVNGSKDFILECLK